MLEALKDWYKSLSRRNQEMLAIFVVLFLLFHGYKLVAFLGRQDDFIPARNVVDPAFLETVIRDNYSGSAQLNPMVIRRDGFLIFDFNSQELCGIAGCLYAAYVNGNHISPSTPVRLSAQGESLRADAERSRSISFYLKQVSKTVNLFSFERQGLANCFVTSQSVTKGIIRTRYCHQQGRLAKVITELRDEK